MRRPLEALEGAYDGGVTSPRRPGDENGVVGFNPFRAQRRRSSDYVLVAAALAVTFALVLWAAFGR